MPYIEKFTPVLSKDERMIWTGRPARSYFGVRSYFWSNLIGLPVFAVFVYLFFRPFIEGGMPKDLIGALFPLFGVIFFGFAIFQHIRSINRHQNSYYGLSDRKVMIVIGGWFPISSTFDVGKLPFASLSLSGPELGTIRFYEKGVLQKDDPEKSAYRPDLPIFAAIANAGEVYKMVLEIQNDARRLA